MPKKTRRNPLSRRQLARQKTFFQEMYAIGKAMPSPPGNLEALAAKAKFFADLTKLNRKAPAPTPRPVHTPPSARS